MADLNSTIVRGKLRVTSDEYLSGNLTVSGTLTGNGSGLTNLNGSNIATGTVAFARLQKTEATTSAAGFLSATDKSHIDTMWSVWSADDGSNTLVDKVQEVLSVFSNYSEGTTIVNALAAKVNKAGDTMTGLLTTTSGSAHTGIKIGNTYITAIDGRIIFQNNSEIRFGADDWAYSKWAGLKYDATNKIVYLGVADNNAFISNTTGYTDGKLYLPGINGAYLGNGTSTQLVTTVSTSGTGLSGGVTAANATGTITLDSSSAGNAGQNKVVLRNAAGSIQTEKLAVSDGATTQVTLQYDSAGRCLDFVFA